MPNCMSTDHYWDQNFQFHLTSQYYPRLLTDQDQRWLPEPDSPERTWLQRHRHHHYSSYQTPLEQWGSRWNKYSLQYKCCLRCPRLCYHRTRVRMAVEVDDSLD